MENKKTLQKLLVCLRIAEKNKTRSSGEESGRQRAYLADRCAALGSAPLSARLDHFHDSRQRENERLAGGVESTGGRQSCSAAHPPLSPPLSLSAGALPALHRCHSPHHPHAPSALHHKVSQTQRVDTRRLLLAPTCSLSLPLSPHHHRSLSLSLSSP